MLSHTYPPIKRRGGEEERRGEEGRGGEKEERRREDKGFELEKGGDLFWTRTTVVRA